MAAGNSQASHWEQPINVFKFLRPAFECLARNEVLGLAFDGGGGKRWTQVDFMARRCNLSTQPVQLVRRTQAALLPTLVVREASTGRHRIIITEALPYQTVKGDRAEEMRVNMQAFVDVFAEWVARHPEHYANFLLLRYKVRASDVMPFFDDYPVVEGQMSAEEAQAHLKAAARKSGGLEDQ